ncbi:MAG TPA: hypothetical protein VGK67_05470 [Myxococcales bacterium]|jgi:uncharacterized spore protein YtfJ
MNLERALKEFGEKLAEEADVRAVFGDPLKLDGHTIIPVAVVHIALAGEGGGRANLSATPVGYLCEEGERVVFKPIELRPYPRPQPPQRRTARPAPARRRR